MNKIKLFVVAAIAMFSAVGAGAQKTGYISLDQVVALMPEVATMEAQLQKYQVDSLNPHYAYMISEYQRKDSMVNSKDSSKTPAATRAVIRQELEGLAYQIQNWQQIAQNAMQGKQNDLLEPVYRKVMNAVNAVAKENGYAYVVDKQTLLVAPPENDLFPLVAKRLNLKTQGTGAGAAAAPAATSGPATGATAKPKGKQ